MSTSTVFRDRLAQEAGILPKEIILEVQLRAYLLEKLAEKGMTTMKEVSSFCRAYSNNPDEAVRLLGLNREELMGKDYAKERKDRTEK